MLSSSFIGPLIIAGVLSSIQNGTITLATSMTPVLLFIATQAYGEIIGWRLNLFAVWTFETAAGRDIYHDIFKKLSSETLDFHSNRFSGSLVSQAGKLHGAFERFWDTLIFQVVPSVTAIIAAIVILWHVFWQYAVVLVVVSIAFVVAVFFGTRFLRIRNTEEAQANTKMTGWLADMLANIVTVKSYAGEQRELETANEVSKVWRQKSLSTMRGFLIASTVYSSLGTILTSTALVGAILASEYSIISIGAVYLALTYTFTVSRQLWEMNSIMRNYNKVMGDAHDMVEILTTPSTLNDTSKKQLPVSAGAIAIKHINFTHDNGRGVEIFQDFSLTIPAGQRLGLVGHSGSGKSSLVRLLLRFSDLKSGTIAIDGQSIAKVTQDSLRQNIAYVPQEPLLFHRSLRDNIRYGKAGADDAAVETAATLANAHEFIMTLPDAYDTLVGEQIGRASCRERV